ISWACSVKRGSSGGMTSRIRRSDGTSIAQRRRRKMRPRVVLVTGHARVARTLARKFGGNETVACEVRAHLSKVAKDPPRSAPHTSRVPEEGCSHRGYIYKDPKPERPPCCAHGPGAPSAGRERLVSRAWASRLGLHRRQTHLYGGLEPPGTAHRIPR